MNTGNLITVQRDINPNSPTYNQTRNVVVSDSTTCPSNNPSWQILGSYCQVDLDNLNTGIKITTEADMNPASPTYLNTRETSITDTVTCPLPNRNPDWLIMNSECVTEIINGLVANTGTLINHQVDINPNSPSFNDTRDQYVTDRTTCPVPNKNPNWVQILYVCNSGNTPYATITEMDENRYSSSWQTTRQRTVYDYSCYTPPYIP